jgi:hypothetical protein
MGIGRRRWWRVAALSALAVLGVVFVVSGVLLRVYGPTFTRERVEALLSETLAQPVRLGAVRLSPWRLGFSLLDLDVPAAPPLDVALHVGAIHISLDLATVWRGEITVSVLARDFRLDAAVPETSEGGGVDIFPLPRHFALGPLRVGIGSVRIREGRAKVRVPDALTIELRGTDLTARPVTGDLDVTGRIETLVLDVLGRSEQLDAVAVDGRLSADVIALRRIGWRWRGEVMQLSGEMRRPWIESRELALRGKGDIALDAVAKAAGLDTRLDGKAHVVAEITGPAAAPAIGGRIRVPELRVAEVVARDVGIDARWADDKLRLDDIQAQLGAGRLRARLQAVRTTNGASFTLDLRELVLPAGGGGLGPATGIAEGRVRDGGVDLDRADVKWSGAALSLGGRIAAGSALALRATLLADLKDVGRSLHWGPVSGRARVSAELKDQGGARAIDGRTEIANLVTAGHAVDPVEASFHLRAVPGADTRWTGTIESPRIRSGQISVEAIMASLAVDAGKIDVIRARARAQAVPVEVVGVWNWSGSGRGRATLGPVALGAISGVPPALHVGGTGRATVDASVDRGTASASGLVDLDQVSAAGVSLGAGRANVRLRGQALDGELSFPARRLRVRTAGRLEAGGTLTTIAELDDLALRPLLSDLRSAAADHIDGRLSSRADLSIPVGDPATGRGTVRVIPDALRLFGQSWTSRGPIVLRWEGPRLLVEQLRIDGPAGSLTASGPLVGPDNQALSLTLDNARLPGALAEVGQGTVRSEVRLAGDGIELRRFDARWPRLTAVASGRTQGDGAIEMTADVDADLAGLGPALGVSGMAGRATFTAQARGRTDAIEATGAVRAPRLQVAGIALTDVDVPFRLSGWTLRVEPVRARLGASPITAAARATWNGRGTPTLDSLMRDTVLTADVRTPAARLEDLAPVLPAAVAGRGEFTLTARGEGTPRAWRGTGTLTSSELDTNAGPLRQLRAAFVVDPTRIEVTDFRVDALGVPTRATASWAWAGGGTVKATLGPAALGELAAVPPAARLRGTGRATIDVVMRASAVSGNVRAELDDVAVAGAVLGRGQVDVSARDGAVRAEVTFPEPRLQASASGRIDAAGTLTAEATAPRIDVGFFARALGAPSDLTGTVSVRATARVPLADPQRGEGVLSIDPIRLVVANDTWENQGPVEARWARGELSIGSFRLAAKEGVVAGRGTVGADGKLDAQVSAQLPLVALRGVRPEIRDVGGVLDVSLRATGSTTAPSFTGDGAIHRGTLLLRDRPEILRDVEARLNLSAQGVQLRDATGTLSGGSVQARGDLALQNWRPGAYRVRLQARNVAVAQIEGFSSAWNADLELSGITREALLTGRARLVRGLYNRDLSIISLALSSSRAPVADSGPALRLQLRVNLDENLVVRNRVADLRVDGVLNVEGTTAHPVVFGSIESREGRITFNGRDWSVTNAAVRFADPRRLDPYLDVVATSRIADYDVTMQVTGPVSNVAVRFSSSPRLSQNDLLSLVAFGVTGADLRESPATVLLGEAGKLLAQDVLGVNPGTRLRITTGSATPNSTNELRGFPGEERTTTPPGQDTTNTPGGRKERVRVEYQLLSPLYLSAEYDRSGGYGGDVILRFRFR